VLAVTSSDPGWRIAVLGEIPPVKPDWPASWKSVRHHLGIGGFGVNAVTKDAGGVLIPEHDERSSGQQELYFIHAGDAIATLDGARVAIATGGFVLCEPHVLRRFEAAASPTTLLIVGGTTGRPFEVGSWES
jgi:hypothetical protein